MLVVSDDQAERKPMGNNRNGFTWMGGNDLVHAGDYPLVHLDDGLASWGRGFPGIRAPLLVDGGVLRLDLIQA